MTYAYNNGRKMRARDRIRQLKLQNAQLIGMLRAFHARTLLGHLKFALFKK